MFFFHFAGGGRESHGRLCHKCGWPFPNPHPSAKQKRAHKRHCGSIHGYKLYVDMDPTLSDDDLPKTPSQYLTLFAYLILFYALKFGELVQ